MSTTIKKNGIILKISDTPGKDKLLQILTGDGIVSAFMTPKRSGGKKSFIFDVFTFGEFIIYVTDKGNSLVNSVNPFECFYGLRDDIVTLSAAAYFSELVRYAATDCDCDFQSLLALFLKALRLLSDGAGVKSVKPVFEFKIAQMLGFAPCLEAEEKSAKYYFDIDDGRLYINEVKNGFPLSRNAVYLIYKILNSDTETAFSYMHDNNELDAVFSIAEQYILYHTEREFSSLKFLNGVI